MDKNEFDFEQAYQVALGKQKSAPQNKGMVNDPPSGVDSPPPGWKKARLPFLQGEFIPEGWRKVGDTYAGPGE